MWAKGEVSRSEREKQLVIITHNGFPMSERLAGIDRGDCVWRLRLRLFLSCVSVFSVRVRERSICIDTYCEIVCIIYTYYMIKLIILLTYYIIIRQKRGEVGRADGPEFVALVQSTYLALCEMARWLTKNVFIRQPKLHQARADKLIGSKVRQLE